jgi:D-glycero-D-manno-heptose 1,7-bisphosphate phosphatase
MAIARYNITIGLDRDGTINKDLGTYVKHPNQLIPISGSLEAVAMLRRKGYNIVILTNQAGISEGVLSIQQVEEVHQKLLQQLGEAGCFSIDGMYYSTSKHKDDIYAKPNIGMFQRAETELGVKFKGGAYVGDKLSDLQAAEKVGALPILVKTGYGQETLEKLNRYAYKALKKKTIVFENLLEFAESLPDTED